MKKLVGVSIFVLLLLGASVKGAESYVNIFEKPLKRYAILLDNERIRVLEIKLKPKDKLEMHALRDHLIYVLKPGKIRYEYLDASTKEMTLVEGQVLWNEGESHSIANSGHTDLVYLVVELKR